MPEAARELEVFRLVVEDTRAMLGSSSTYAPYPEKEFCHAPSTGRPASANFDIRHWAIWILKIDGPSAIVDYVE